VCDPAHGTNSATTNIHRVIAAHNEVSQKEAKIHMDHLILVAAMRSARLNVDPTPPLFQDRNASYSGDNYTKKRRSRYTSLSLLSFDL
jgi:hypothetical protein